MPCSVHWAAPTLTMELTSNGKSLVNRFSAQEHRSGRNDASSDEDEPAEESGPLHGSLLGADDQNVHRDLEGNVVQPSLAFCQALDHEQEYDEVDAVAGTSLRGTDLTDVRPHRLTEVLDDNAFDRRMRSRLAPESSQAAPEIVDMDTDLVQSSSRQSQSCDVQCCPMDFALAFGYQQFVDAFMSASGNNHDNQAMSRQQQPWPGRGTSNRRVGSHRRSTVPDHVRHPDKYTCYVLDESLLVGGGDKAANIGGGKAELAKAARAASSAAAAAQMPVQAQEQPLELPAFGSGIEFRPRKKSRQQPKAEAPAAAFTHIVSGLAQDDEDVVDAEQASAEQVSVNAADALQPGAAVKPRRRQYRSKPGIS